jgi:hypothetical protein
MTDVTPIGRRGPRRGFPLCLADDVFERIVQGREDLQHPDGAPNIARIAHMAGVHRQRLNEVANGSRGLPGIYAMGTAIHCYAKVHGVTDKEAMAVLLYVPDDENAAEAVAA